METQVSKSVLQKPNSSPCRCKESCRHSYYVQYICLTGRCGTQNRIHLKFSGAGSIDTTHNFTVNIMGWYASHPQNTIYSKLTSALKYTPPKQHTSPVKMLVVSIDDGFFFIGDLLPPSKRSVLGCILIPKLMEHRRNSLKHMDWKKHKKKTKQHLFEGAKKMLAVKSSTAWGLMIHSAPRPAAPCLLSVDQPQ